MLKGLFRVATVDAIVADIRAMVEKLHIVKEAQEEEASLHAKAVEEYTRLKALAEAESERALRLATKFEELIK